MLSMNLETEIILGWRYRGENIAIPCNSRAAKKPEITVNYKMIWGCPSKSDEFTDKEQSNSSICTGPCGLGGEWEPNKKHPLRLWDLNFPCLEWSMSQRGIRKWGKSVKITFMGQIPLRLMNGSLHSVRIKKRWNNRDENGPNCVK